MNGKFTDFPKTPHASTPTSPVSNIPPLKGYICDSS